jgi:predicted DNA-binding transcriptional regulator AlpA
MSNEVLDSLRTLSVRQLAAAMNLPTWQIYEMIRNAEAPPHFRIGKVRTSRQRQRSWNRFHPGSRITTPWHRTRPWASSRRENTAANSKRSRN